MTIELSSPILRRRISGLLAAIVVALCAAPAAAQSSLQQRLEAHVTYLASSDLEGRGNGSQGLREARNYVAGQMEQIGLEPGGTDGYFSALEAVTRAELSRDLALEMGKQVLAEGVEFSPAAFSDGGDFAAEAVFVGYGLSAPLAGYDDYAGVDVDDKVVVALTGAPDDIERALDQREAGYLLSSGSKAAVASSFGARAIILVNDPRGHGEHSDQRPDKLSTLRPAPALEGISAAHLTARAAARAFSQVGVDLGELQRQIDRAGEPASLPLQLEVRGNLSIERQTSTIYNVVGLLPGAADASGEALVATAHYDGLGFGHAGSLVDERASSGHDKLHPGADDNASGVAVLLETARALVDDPPTDPRPVVFATPVGEELMLRGSRRLARQLVERFGGGTVVNLDMVGRLRDDTLHVAHDEPLATITADASRQANLTVDTGRLEERFTDHIAFVDLGFRALNLTTGRHGDYHVPGDTIDKINWSGMVRVTRFLEQVLRDLS
ncbi:MAG: M28 family peptidase [Persicimonas sp.]